MAEKKDYIEWKNWKNVIMVTANRVKLRFPPKF